MPAESSTSTISMIAALVLAVAIGYQAGTLKTTDTARPADSSKPVQQLLQHADVKNELSSEYLLFIGIITAPKNVEKRSAIRRTWLKQVAEHHNIIQARFFVGQSSLDESIVVENKSHGDIMRLSVNDGYSMLSTKVPAAMRMTCRNFGGFKYFMKVDDDTFLNVDTLVTALAEVKRKTIYLGATWSGSKPHRNPQSKHYLPYTQYPKAMVNLPPYNEGGGYVLSSDIVQYIDQNRRFLRPLGQLEDVTIAMWLIPLQVHPTSDRRFISKNLIAGHSLTVNPKLRLKHCHDDLIIMPDVEPDLMYSMWDYVERGWGVCGAVQTDILSDVL